MKWSDFATRLTGEMLKEPRALTIKEIAIEEVHPRPGTTEQSPVAHFDEIEQSLVLSPTNCRTLAHLFGDDVAACRGQRVAVSALSMRVAGRDRLPVRISAIATPAPVVGAKPAEIAKSVAAQPPAAATHRLERQTPPPVGAPDAAARAEFYALSAAAIRDGRLTSQQINGLVRGANGDGFAGALQALRALLANLDPVEEMISGK